ncbi:MAG TPA: RNA 2',3'-cyclic phosphodiesterase [Mycobacteriales bacterium]|nr:RNA 2',3'-cyclic phosphodiesterase [Mycobacteriales bacterium]
MRLFAAVVPPAAALDHLEDALREVALDRLRPVPRHQWHLTVAFFGEVPERVADDLAERLGRVAARTEPLSLRLRGGGTFPKQAARARQLWVGVDAGGDELARLADRAAAAGRRCGLPMEDRPFRAHLTLGRARRGVEDLTDAVAALSSYDGSPWAVRTLRLVRSTLGAQVRHETWHEWPLGRPAGGTAG